MCWRAQLHSLDARGERGVEGQVHSLEGQTEALPPRPRGALHPAAVQVPHCASHICSPPCISRSAVSGLGRAGSLRQDGGRGAGDCGRKACCATS
eukprot:2552675-Rhodomonas_salina.4